MTVYSEACCVLVVLTNMTLIHLFNVWRWSSNGFDSRTAVLRLQLVLHNQSFTQLRCVDSFVHSGILNLPAVALGIITGGFVMKRFKLGVIGAARVSITASFGSLCLLFFQIFLHCDNAEVAGLTVSYQGWVENLNPFSVVFFFLI